MAVAGGISATEVLGNEAGGSSPAGALEARVLDGVLRCVARWGVAKTTVDDVAREAGCSRATLYRAFPGGKEAVLRAALWREIRALDGAVVRALESREDLAGAVVAAMGAAGRFLRGHAALQFVVAYEPELVMPHLAFARNEILLRRSAAALAPSLTRWLPAEEAEPAAEWLCRIVVSYLLCPSPDVDFDAEESIVRIVDRFVLPALLSRPAITVP